MARGDFVSILAEKRRLETFHYLHKLSGMAYNVFRAKCITMLDHRAVKGRKDWELGLPEDRLLCILNKWSLDRHDL